MHALLTSMGGLPFTEQNRVGDTDWEHSGGGRKGMGEEEEGETTFRM